MRRIPERLEAAVQFDDAVDLVEWQLRVASGEATKSGLAPGEVAAVARAVALLPGLRLRGLMTLPAPSEGLDAQRLPFARLARCLAELQRDIPGLDTLSMGMSDDYPEAIQEGSTLVRVGSAIFGPPEGRGGEGGDLLARPKE